MTSSGAPLTAVSQDAATPRSTRGTALLVISSVRARNLQQLRHCNSTKRTKPRFRTPGHSTRRIVTRFGAYFTCPRLNTNLQGRPCSCRCEQRSGEAVSIPRVGRLPRRARNDIQPFSSGIFVSAWTHIWQKLAWGELLCYTIVGGVEQYAACPPARSRRHARSETADRRRKPRHIMPA